MATGKRRRGGGASICRKRLGPCTQNLTARGRDAVMQRSNTFQFDAELMVAHAAHESAIAEAIAEQDTETRVTLALSNECRAQDAELSGLYKLGLAQTFAGRMYRVRKFGICMDYDADELESEAREMVSGRNLMMVTMVKAAALEAAMGPR